MSLSGGLLVPEGITSLLVQYGAGPKNRYYFEY